MRALGPDDAEIEDSTQLRRIEPELRDSRDQLRLAFSAARMGIWDWDVSSGALGGSPGLDEIHGTTPGSFDGTFDAFIEIARPDDRDGLRAEIGAALATGHPFATEFRDRLIAAIGLALDRPLSLDERLDDLARALLPEVAGACVVDLIEDDGSLRRAASAHVDAGYREMLGALPAPRPDSPIATRSAVIVPLVARGRRIGVMSLSTSRRHSDRALDERDLRLAERVAARVALAIDNARLFEMERSARRRTEYLSEASGVLNSSLEHEHTLQALAGIVVPELAGAGRNAAGGTLEDDLAIVVIEAARRG